jgi:hypothetical protein
MTYDKNTFLPPRHEFNASKTQDPCSSSFKQGLPAADMASLKSTVEANFPGVGLNYSGAEFDYDVVLEGPRTNFQTAVAYIFPNNDPNVTRNPGRWRP